MLFVDYSVGGILFENTRSLGNLQAWVIAYRESQEQTWLADTRVANQQKFEEIIAAHKPTLD